MKFAKKIAVALRDDLAPWQKFNVTAFTISGIAGTVEGILGEVYEDGSGNTYLPMFKQPVLIFRATTEQMNVAYLRALSLQVPFSLFTEDLFVTDNDRANRAAVKARQQADLSIVGLAVWAEKKSVATVFRGLSLHP